MINRTTCPNCQSEVEGWALGYGQNERGETEFGCEVCVTPRVAPTGDEHTPENVSAGQDA